MTACYAVKSTIRGSKEVSNSLAMAIEAWTFANSIIPELHTPGVRRTR
jgi:hypothetical protein